MDASPRMPAAFVGHGSPLLLDDARWVSELRRWAAAMPRPRAILVLSGHWIEAQPTLSTTFPNMPLLHDFVGLPKRYAEVTYAHPPAKDLRSRVRELLAEDAVRDALTRGLDSGAYVPLVAMFPAADVPVLQASLPTLEIAPLVELGRRLASLRDEGVLILCSGVIVHNVREVSYRPDVGPPPWARAFDAWTAQVLASRDVKALERVRQKAPDVKMALPTLEHFVPVAVALGTSLDRQEPVAFPVTGFAYGSMSKRSVQFG